MKDKEKQPEETKNENSASQADEKKEIQKEEAEEDELTEIEALRAELETLREENRALKESREKEERQNSRMEKEIAEFSEYFPDTELSDVPESVWEEVRRGLPLSAAYARHEQKVRNQKRRADEVNEANGNRSGGSVAGGRDYYYSPSEVRKMSASEVKKNYTHIINSMKHWN